MRLGSIKILSYTHAAGQLIKCFLRLSPLTPVTPLSRDQPVATAAASESLHHTVSAEADVGPAGELCGPVSVPQPHG